MRQLGPSLRTTCAALLIATTACTKAEEKRAAPPLDVPLATGQARAGLITKDTELLHGTTAKGRVGDYKLYNSKIAVVIAQPGSARGYQPYGGTILDADRIRPDGEPGQSTFGEVIVALDLSVMKPTSVEVVSDGTGGGAARLRLHGVEATMPFFDAIFSELFSSSTVHDTEWTIDYVLEPDAEWLRVEHDLKNHERTGIDYGLPIVAFMFGDGATPYMNGYGFTPPTSSAFGPYYGAIAERVSYLYGRLDATVTEVVSESGVIVTGIGDGFSIPGGAHASLTHYLVVGDGDLSRTQAIWNRLAGGAANPTISGRVVDASGAPVVDARVHVTLQTPSDADKDYVSMGRTDADGRYAIALPPGKYAATVASNGYVYSDRKPFELTAAGAATLDVSLPLPGFVRYSVTDEASRKLPVKLSVEPRGHSVAALPARYGERSPAYGLQTTVFGVAGEGRFAVPAGAYHVLISRGAEYEIAEADVVVPAGGEASFTAQLTRSVDTTGWQSTDTHVHAQLSPDSPDLYPLKVSSMVSEGLEIPVSTEHESIGDFNPAIHALGLEPWIQGIVGTEITTTVYGHFNAFPLVPDPTKPGNGRVEWYKKKPGETFAAAHAHAGDPFLQVNHPRSAAIGGYFSAMGFDPGTFAFERPGDASLDFDGVEVANGCDLDGIEAVTADWFALLNHGHRVYATGSTDNHHAENGEMGFPRTYVRMPTDDPPQAKVDDVRAAFKSGRLVVTCGPFLELKAGDKQIGDTARASGDSITVDVRVAAPAWMDVTTLEVVVNGTVAKTLPLDAPGASTDRFKGSITVPVPAGRDGWVLVRARGDRAHGVWARSRPSYGFTNPIFLDGNGDGAWSMP